MRILIIDDEYVALAKMVAILTGYGDCDCATNGRQAFEMYSEASMQGQPYDLIVMDINMPEMDGLSLLERIYRAEQQDPASRVAHKIIVSAAGNAENVIKAGHYRCSAFMVKPVMREALCQKLAGMGFEPRQVKPPQTQKAILP